MRPHTLFIISYFLCLSVQSIAADTENIVPEHQRQNPWYQNGQASIAEKLNYLSPGKAKNIILFVGDGMGVSTVTAARILDGQLKGMKGEENNLSFDTFPFTGLVKTYNVDAQTPDSAGTMTAMATGVKTNFGVIGVDEHTKRGDCGSQKSKELVTLLELAELAGKSTGIVSTARITHATPAALFAKSADRNWEDNFGMPKTARDEGCEDIALQLIQFEQSLKARFPQAKLVDGLDVVLGGGRRHFLPRDNSGGRRTDGRNLITEWQASNTNGIYVSDKTQFDELDPSKASKVLGLFNPTHMQYENERRRKPIQEPSLSEMTIKAVDMLQKNKRGFFLMVESGRIDHAHHETHAHGALTETIAFSKAVQAAIDRVDLQETLVLVTADHSHVFTLAGYPKRGNPILGKVVSVGKNKPALALDNLPYTTLGYANGFGAAGRRDLSKVDTTSPGFAQEALVPLSSETHGGEDVVVYGIGAGSPLVSGTLEQNVIFHVINHAGQLSSEAEKQLRQKASATK